MGGLMAHKIQKIQKNEHQLITGCYAENQTMCLHCIKRLERSLGVEDIAMNKEVINYIIESNGIEGFIKHLKNSKNSYPHGESTESILNILINICFQDSKYAVEHVVNQNAIPLLIEFLSSTKSLTVKESIVWCLNNIIATDVKYRDLCLEYDVLDHIEKLSKLKSFSWSLNRILSRALCAIVFHHSLKLEFGEKLINILDIFFHYQDEEISSYVCWAFSWLTEQDIYHSFVMNTNRKNKLFHFLQHKSSKIRYRSLETFCNILTQYQYTNIVLKMGTVSQLKLLMNDEERTKYVVCLMLANITAEEQYIENVIHSKLVPVLIENVLNVNEYNSVRIRTESLWA
eukprot:232453_1